MQPHETNQKLLAFSRWIDGSYEQHVQNNEELMLHRRLGKITEENGEVSEALSGYLGENPRKGRTHELKDVQKELLDVAVTALGAWSHTTGNQRRCS